MLNRDKRTLKEAKVNAAIVRSLLDYDPETGAFTWKASLQGKVKAGDRAGGIRLGRRGIEIKDTRYQASRLAWLLMTGSWPLLDIDHIDGDPLNDRFANLREATHGQNMANRKIAKHNRCGAKGVIWSEKDKLWLAAVRKDRKEVHRSYHHTIEEAAAAYARAAAEAHGEFARVESD